MVVLLGALVSIACARQETPVVPPATVSPTSTSTPTLPPTAHVVQQMRTPEPTATAAPIASPTLDPTPKPTLESIPTPTAAPTPTPEPTSTPVPQPTATPTPEPTATPTATPSPTPTPTPSPTATQPPTPTGARLPWGPTGVYYDIAADVPAEQVEIITTGLQIAQDFLDSGLGGGISTEARKNITVKIVATGRGTEERWGGGACCTALSSTSGSLTMWPFFDVAHPHWDFSPTSRRYWTLDADHWKTAIHEYTHIWQFHLGCLSSRRLGNWLSEGMAEFIAYEAMIRNGDMRQEDVTAFMLSAARGTGQFDRPLRDFGEGAIRDIGIWPGHVGFVALHRIVPSAPGGILSSRTLCEEVGDGASVPDAFETAFGVSLDDFYADFEKYREELNAG